MANSQEMLVQGILRSEIGKTATFWRYGREDHTPLNFVLDEIERQTESRLSLFWVDDGPPEVFTLPGFSPSPVIFSTRYLFLSAFVRHLFVDEWMKDVLDEVAEQSALKVMAEVALRSGDPDYAVLSFVKSVINKGIWLNDGDQLVELEHSPKNEAYMAIWFFGVLHEVGHLQSDQSQHFLEGQKLSDAGMLKSISDVLDGMVDLPDALRQEAIERATRPGSQSLLAVEHLRRECLADIFAMSALFQTTYDIMQKVNQERFQVSQFIGEMIIILNTVAFLERCRRVALIASATTPDREAQFEGLLHPVSIGVRAQMQRHFLESALMEHLFGSDNHTLDQFQRVEHLIDQINERLSHSIKSVEKGLSRAMEFSLFHERRDNDWALLELFRKELCGSVLGRLEAQRFCGLADLLKKDSKLVQVLKSIVEDPGKPLSPDPSGDLVYFVPWAEGPNNFSRPFGLDTKHGHLVFVFVRQDDLCRTFTQISSAMVLPGFTLKNAAVCVPRKERLGAELTANMPVSQPFRVVVEGTEEFAENMKELVDGTIWKD